MNIFRVGIELFSLYLLYKLIFDVIIPGVKQGNHIKGTFREMKNNQQNFSARKQENPPSDRKASTKPNPEKDYLDFEEIK